MLQLRLSRVGRNIITAVLLIAFGWSEPAGAAPLDRFAGSFRASGLVAEGPDAAPQEVTCSFTVRQDEDRITLDGTCRAHLIFSRSISADLALDPRSGRVTGSYTGASVGTARLNGRLRGGTIDAVVTWPRPVYGDTTANMRIASADPNRLRITVTDRIGADGPIRPMTDLTLERQ